MGHVGTGVDTPTEPREPTWIGRVGTGVDACSPRPRAAPAPTCDAVLDLPLHLEGVHIDGPVPDEAGASDAPVRLAEPVLVVVVSAETHSL